VGRRAAMPLGPRPIDLDLLLYDDAIVREADIAIPHDGLATRAFVLVPLAEIAPERREPVSGKTIRELALRVDASNVRRFDAGVLMRVRRDVQESPPNVALALNRAGVRGVKALITIGDAALIGNFDVYADLDARRSGVHMSRFSQDLEDALTELASASAGGLEAVALALAQRVVESQGAESAAVDARLEFPLHRHTPVSAIKTREFYTAVAKAVVARGHRRSLIGVEAEGITACPCARSMVAEDVRERLSRDGFDTAEIERILSIVPIATHNQRSVGTLLVGAQARVELPTLVEIVEQSMSSETYDLLKRPDELFVVNKAHASPRFVEDCVREILRYAHAAFEDFPDDTFLFARQVNYESIHKHDAVAESCQMLGELRRELRGDSSIRHTTLEEWLYPAARERSSP